MIKNYFIIAWRNIKGNKVYSALNVVGLAAGMAVALLIGLWVINQFSFDRFLPNYNQVYQVELNFTDPHEGTHTQGAVAIPLAALLRTTVPGIEFVAETDWVGEESHDLLVGTKKLLIKGGSVAPDFLKIFQYPLLRGNAGQVFKDDYSIVINESTAKALFGKDDPINKTIRIDNQHDVKVTGVMKDIPANSSLQFSYLLPFRYTVMTEDGMKNASTQWNNNSFEIFVSLQPGVTKEQIASKIKNLVYANNPPARPVKPEVILHPLKDWHLNSEFKNGKPAGGFIDYVRMFGMIGVLVLLIACINFMNLSTARSEKRAREVGVRKAVGSLRRDLIYQFLTESILTACIACLLSLFLVWLALPHFNTLISGSVHIPFDNLIFWGVMVGYVFITGVLAGIRPAFYLSSFNAVSVLKGSFQAGKGAASLRKILVVIQFSCSVALIISTVIIYKQIQYAKDRPMGYSVDRLLTTPISGDLSDHYEAIKNDLMASRVVEGVTKASSPLTGIYWHTGIEKWPGQTAGDLGINVGGVSIADNYFKTVGMRIIEGRDFSSNWSTDTSNIIINEAAVKRMGLKEPLNQVITYDGLRGPARIIGVVNDALMESPFTPVEPTVFNHGRGGNYLIYRLTKGINPHQAIGKISGLFDKYNPAYPYTYGFVDEDYDTKFNLETLVGKLAGLFAGLAIFISCLGLFGLAAFLAEKRTKEIGIRKLLGASILQVWVLLSRDFILLVLLSCLIASPVALYFLKHWLEKYDYRITIGPGVFILSGIIAMMITLFTVSFQAIKAAFMNPARSLRTE